LAISKLSYFTAHSSICRRYPVFWKRRNMYQ